MCLPCHPDHKFDLECVRPWLKLNSTCPLDRRDLLPKKEEKKEKKSTEANKAQEEDEEEDYDMDYA